MNKKILTIHSEDRDINKWPNPNEFELYLPDSYVNIRQMNLLNFTNINNFYNISENLMNNYINTGYNSDLNTSKIFIIPNGYYTPDYLAITLTKLFQSTFYNTYVIYDRIKFKFLFITKDEVFNLNFADLISTDKLCINKKFLLNPEKIAYQYSHWGLGYNLGFSKKNYKYDTDFFTTQSRLDNELEYSKNINNFDICINDIYHILPSDILSSDYYRFLYSENTIDLNPLNTIYMEIDKHNYADEIKPYQYRSNYLYCNDYNATVNSYFAKILFNNDIINENKIITNTKNDGEIFNGSLLYNNTIDRLIKLKFKFRYHNGVLVDFGNKNFNFTLEFVQHENIKKI